MKVRAPEDGVNRPEGPPEGVGIEAFPSSGSFSGGDASNVRFVVPKLVLPAKAPGPLGEMGDLEVARTFSAGAGWNLPHVPKSVALRDARGVHCISISDRTSRCVSGESLRSVVHEK